MKILVLDPSAGTTGWAFFDGHAVVEASYKVFTKVDLDGERYLDAHRWLKDMIYVWKPDLVIMESYFFSSRFATGSAVNSEVRGVMKMTCSEAGVSYILADPMTWKKKLIGRVRPTKEENKLYGKTKAKKEITKIALEKLGFVFPDKVLNPKTGKQVAFKFDTSDALGILVAHLMENQIQYTISPDLFKKEDPS